MPRVLKPVKVDSVHHDRLGVRVDIMLDRNNNTFFAEYTTITVRAKSADECKREAWKLIESQAVLEFRKIIQINRLQPFCRDGSAFVGMEFSRHDIAPSSGYPNHWVERHWVEEGEEMPKDWKIWISDYSGCKPGSTEPGFNRQTNTAHACCVPYSKEAWIALEALEANIRRACAQLDEMMKDPEFNSKLQLIAAKLQPMLPPAKDPSV